MKFFPGDTYLYDSVHGYQTLVVRSDTDRWVSVPVQEETLGPITDEIMEAELSNYSWEEDRDRTIFARRGVDILPEVVLGYADNIVF